MAIVHLDLKTHIAVERGSAGKSDSSNLTSSVLCELAVMQGGDFTSANGHLVNILIYTFY